MNEYIHKTQYYETDQMQIVHHSNYIRWFEEARSSYLERVGFGYDRMEKEGIMCPVIDVRCKYKSMVRFPDEVRIQSWISSYNGVKLTIEYVVRDKDTDVIRARGQTLHCFISEIGRPISLAKVNAELDNLFKQSQAQDSHLK